MDNNAIPAVFWMIVISVVSGMFTLILYYVAMLVRESTSTLREVQGTIRDSREILQGAKKIVEDSSEIVSVVKGSVGNLKTTLDEFNTMLLVPIRSISSFISGFLK